MKKIVAHFVTFVLYHVVLPLPPLIPKVRIPPGELFVSQQPLPFLMPLEICLKLSNYSNILVLTMSCPLHLYFSCLFERISPLFLLSSSGKIMSFSPLLDLSSTSAMLLGIFVTGGVFARKVHSGTRTLLPYLPVVLLHNHNHHCLDYLISN